jgi:hypothetical protein
MKKTGYLDSSGGQLSIDTFISVFMLKSKVCYIQIKAECHLAGRNRYHGGDV